MRLFSKEGVNSKESKVKVPKPNFCFTKFGDWFAYSMDFLCWSSEIRLLEIFPFKLKVTSNALAKMWNSFYVQCPEGISIK